MVGALHLVAMQEVGAGLWVHSPGGPQLPRPAQKVQAAHPRVAGDLEQGLGLERPAHRSRALRETRLLPNSKPSSTQVRIIILKAEQVGTVLP